MARTLYAIALLALVPFVALAQTSITEGDVTITTTPPSITPVPSGDPTPGTMTVECWRMTTIAGQPASILIEPSAASISGAECWEVYPIGGGVASVPYTATDPSFAPTADAANASSSPTSTSSNRAVKVLMPALIGSLGGLILLIGATLWFLRLRMRRKLQASRARRWAERNSGSWAMTETSQKKGGDANPNVGPVQQPYGFNNGV